MAQKSVFWGIWGGLFLLLMPINVGYAIETPHLSIHELTGRLSPDRVQGLAHSAEEALKQILEFWSAGPRVSDFGKIRVELDKPRAGIYASVFVWGKVEGRKTRIVKIFGVDEKPQMMFHKLTHAVFPNNDKLIRNMMGIPMEVKFGNPLTFPMCGHKNDTWVLAMRKVKSYIPLEELGPDHEQWGMSTREGLPVVVDGARQHRAYAESGSLGMYLLNTHGIEKIKTFNRLSHQKERPWAEVFGLPLGGLEKGWVESLDSIQKAEEKNISALTELLKSNPEGACSRPSAKPSGPRKK